MLKYNCTQKLSRIFARISFYEPILLKINPSRGSAHMMMIHGYVDNIHHGVNRHDKKMSPSTYLAPRQVARESKKNPESKNEPLQSSHQQRMAGSPPTFKGQRVLYSPHPPIDQQARSHYSRVFSSKPSHLSSTWNLALSPREKKPSSRTLFVRAHRKLILVRPCS